MINVISFGAGKQSSYMLLRALEGHFDTKPDLAIFSDTGCEPKYTMDYLYRLKDYVKTKYDFDIIIVREGNLMQDIEDYVDGKRSRVSAIPIWSKETGAPMNRHCTLDYKIKPLRRYLQKIRNKQRVKLWIGISLDEIERIKESNVKYIEHYYPLIEYRIGIDNIKKWYNETNTEEPIKSSCLICPFHSRNYWTLFKNNFPDEFEKACKFDEKIRNYPKMNNEQYLFRDRKPLRDIDFTRQPSLFPELIEECYGLCGL